MIEKMMNDVVVDEIKNIDISNKDPSDYTSTIIRLENRQISMLQKVDDPNLKISLLLQKSLEPLDLKLKYKGKTKIRKDVILNFKSIAELLRHDEHYPYHIRKQTVKKCIKDILVDGDERVFCEYLKSINDIVNLSYYDYMDITPFVEAVRQHLSTSSFEDLK